MRLERKYFFFFNCPLDGEQFKNREALVVVVIFNDVIVTA